MKLTFYRPKNGLLNEFLEKQIKLAELTGVEVVFENLNATSAITLLKMINDSNDKDSLKTFEDLTHYIYVFTDSNDEILLILDRPLDYLDLNFHLSFMKGENLS